MAFKLFFPYSNSTVARDTINGIMAVLDDELVEGHYKIEDGKVFDLDKHPLSKDYLAATLEEIKDLPECEVCHKPAATLHKIYAHEAICGPCIRKIEKDIDRMISDLGKEMWLRPQTCKKCGHVWTPRKPREPETCPNPACRSPYWNS
jgi:predicted Zn-ribbon and HTH transcriptional regulator